MPPPSRAPIGFQLTQTTKAVSRAFDDALGAAGGSLPTWLVLMSLKTRRPANQRELADAVGIREATLTHHLNAMEHDGLLTRTRDPENRRIQRVELTATGDAAFLALRSAAITFDEQLREAISESDVATLIRVLDQMKRNVSAT